MIDFLDWQVNRQYYGTIDTPDYDFSRIANKFMAIYQSNDNFSDERDIERFKNTIKGKFNAVYSTATNSYALTYIVRLCRNRSHRENIEKSSNGNCIMCSFKLFKHGPF